MANVRQTGGSARWEPAILWTGLILSDASGLTFMAAIIGGLGNANVSVRNLAHIAVIIATLVGMTGISLVVWVLLQDTSPTMHLWRACTMVAFLAYALGGSYEVLARELIGHPLPRLEQLAPGVTTYLPVITWVVVITLIVWGVLATRHARSIRERAVRQRHLPTPPPSAT